MGLLDSYKVNQTAPGILDGFKVKLNTNSISGIPYAPQNTKSLGQTAAGIGNFVTGSEQALGTIMGKAFGSQSFPPAVAQTMNNSANQLVTHANSLPKGDARRTQLLNIAKQITDVASGQANEQLANVPSKTDAILALGGTAADLLTAGTYKGVEQAGMETGKLAVKGVPSIVEGAQKVAQTVSDNAAESSAKKTTAKIVDMVSPKMTAEEAASAAAERGTTKTGLLGTIKTVIDPYVQKVGEAVQKFVPEFDPAKTLSENINSTRKAVYSMASDLKQKVIAAGDGLVPFKELSAKFNEIGKGSDYIGLKGTQFERQLPELKQAAIDEFKKNGGKVSGLFNARKSFDELVSKTYPNLYDKEYTPIRQAVAAIRNTMTDLTEKYLPDGIGFKDSLGNQSKLFSAIENMSERAASGAEKEIGTNAVGRFMASHPVASKAIGYGASAVGGAVLGGLGIEALKGVSGPNP